MTQPEPDRPRQPLLEVKLHRPDVDDRRIRIGSSYITREEARAVAIVAGVALGLATLAVAWFLIGLVS